MNQFINKLKFEILKKFMQMLNNINNNNFNTLKKFKKNIIEIDNHFWNLNMDSKKYYIHLNQKNYTFAKNHKFIDYKNLMENVQYNNI